MMQTSRMIAIALLAGFVGAGFVWYTWSLFENILAARRAPEEGDAAKGEGASARQVESAKSEPDVKSSEKPVRRK